MQVPVIAASHLTVQAYGSSQNRSIKHHQKKQEASPPERENESHRYMAGQAGHQYSGLRPIDNDSFSEQEVDHEEEEEASLDFNAIQMNQMQHDVEEEEEDEY